MKKWIQWIGLALLFLEWALPSQAFRVDTVFVHSASMQKEVPVVYILPDKALQGEACPVVYLLHGYSDNYKTWISRKPDLKQQADDKGFIFVCPDGSTSWYWDSPQDSTFRYETFVARELVRYTDSHYPTLRNPKGRAISGQSMGGHGALWLAVHYPDMFGAAGSMSGGVDILPFPKNWEIDRRLGNQDEYPEVWEAHTVINCLPLFKQAGLDLIIDCGSSDFFYEVNCQLHRKLLEQGVRHDFIVRPGGHSWEYWVSSFDFQLLFFEKYFKS